MNGLIAAWSPLGPSLLQLRRAGERQGTGFMLLPHHFPPCSYTVLLSEMKMVIKFETKAQPSLYSFSEMTH